jgi:hypothetical protein
MPTRTAEEAIAWGRTQLGKSGWDNLCLSFVRQSFGVDYVGDWPNASRMAGTAWDRARFKHRTSDPMSIPRGVPVFFELLTEADHVVLSLGNGRCLSNDFVVDGRIDEVSIGDIAHRWGPLLGWTEDLVGNRVYTPKTAPPPKPAPPERFSVGLVPGLWDAPEDAWKSAIAAAVYADAEVILLTETTVDGLMQRVKPDGWAVARLDGRYGQSECSIMWDTKRRKLVGDPYPTVLADTQFYTGKGHLRPKVTAITVALQDRDSGDVDMFSAFHAPNGDTTAREKAHDETLAGVPDVWEKGRDRFPDAGRVLGFDLNRDLRRKEYRDAWAEAFPRLELCWSAAGLPKRGTLGPKVYDAVAAGRGRLVTVKAHVVANPKRMDHNVSVVTLERVQ